MLHYWNPRETFDAVKPYVPPELVDSKRINLCQGVADTLPCATSSYYLECRLDEDEQVDFLTLTRSGTAASQFRDALGERRPEPWVRTLRLFEAWEARESGLARVPFHWLEYDIDGRLQLDAPVASPGFCLESNYLARFHVSRIQDRTEAYAMAKAGLEILLEPRQCAETLVVIRRCLELLPAGGSLIHVSAMLTRNPIRTKLYFALPKVAALQFLQQIGWRGDADAVRKVLAESCHALDTLFLDLAVDSDVCSSLGVAFSQFHAAEMNDFDPTWSWLSFVGTQTNKVASLRNWPGTVEQRLDGTRCWLHRWLDIKLVLGADGSLRHKAYLGFMPMLPPAFA